MSHTSIPIRLISIYSWVLLSLLIADRAGAHGIPILISANAGQQLFTDKQVYNNGTFELLGGVILTTDLPGYSVVDSKQGIASGTTLKLNVVDQLLWWQNGKVRLDSTQKLDLVNPEGDTTTVDKDTTFIGGYPIEFYDSSPGWHEHVDYTMQSTKAPAGAYGLLLQVTAAGYQKSANFLVVLNNGLSAGAFATATADLTKAEFQKPGDANGDGLVDGVDYTLWADHFLLPATWRNGNFTYDAIVDGADYTVWADHFSPFPSASLAVVPEPSALVLAGLGSGVLLFSVALRKRVSGN